MEPLTPPAWADDMNVWFTENSYAEHVGWLPRLWQTMWLEHDNPRQALGCLRHPWFSQTKPTADGEWFSFRAIDRFLCVRQLPIGPIRKLSDWEQLDVGRSILWHPEPDDQMITFAEDRAARLRAQGRGHFDVQHREDGTLWVGREKALRLGPTIAAVRKDCLS
jgi:hypothetical protein